MNKIREMFTQDVEQVVGEIASSSDEEFREKFWSEIKVRFPHLTDKDEEQWETEYPDWTKQQIDVAHLGDWILLLQLTDGL